MVEIADIKDQESLKAWLEGQPREVSVWIASRAAARELPLWWQAVLTEYRARKPDLTALPALRSLLISSVAARVPTDDIKAAADAAGDPTRAAVFEAADATDEPLRAFAAASDAAYAATYAADAATRAAAGSAYSADAAAQAASWTAIRTDVDAAADGHFPDALALWPEGQNPFERDWSDIKAAVAASLDARDWQFWLDWYDALLEGRTLLSDPARTWEMLEQIALIEPATWDAGPEAVNPKIREIWELYRLRVKVAALQAEKEAFLAARASQAQRSHNQPPDGLVDDQPELARQITIVWDSLDEARDELEQTTPDKGWLRAIAEKLLSALTAVAKYCAKVADTAVISAAKVGGGAVGTAVLDHVVNNGRLLQFAKDLLTYGTGG